MAIDTAEKRKSISGIGGPPLIPGVTPMGSGLDQEWRQEGGWSYNGILAGVPAEIAARETAVTIFAGMVGVTPTNYRVLIRRREGSQVVDTVAGIGTLRATLHARSNLLGADTTIVATEDTYLDQGSEFTDRSALAFMQFRHIDPSSQTNMLMEFDVSALAGLVWNTVKLNLTYEDSVGSTPQGDPQLARVLRAVTFGNAQASWRRYATALTWETPGATGALDIDQASELAWTNFPVAPYAVDQVVTSPDITDLVNDAITLQSGILFLLARIPGAPSTTQRFHSTEAAVADASKPNLFFEAF